MPNSYSSARSPSPLSKSHYGSAILRSPSDLSLGRTQNRSYGSSSRRQSLETQEVLRIMDPSYLSPQNCFSAANRNVSQRSLSGDCYQYYVDSQGHLHDIDYQPFPSIQPVSPNSICGEPTSTRRSPKRSHTSPLPRPRSPQVPYWETFSIPYRELTEDEEEADSELHIPRSNGTESQVYLPYHSYTDYVHQRPTTSIPLLSIDERTGRRVLTKAREKSTNTNGSLLNGMVRKDMREDTEEDDVGRETRGVGCKGGEELKRARNPKQMLHRTWVATRFNMHLRVIRSQRWLKECLRRM